MNMRIGWAVLDPRQVRAIAQRISSPGSMGTVDELGLGAITDALAEVLFPAFTTLMTRARYFIFVRGIMDRAAHNAWRRIDGTPKEPSADDEKLFRRFRHLAEQEVESVEFALTYALVRSIGLGNVEGEGVIGRVNIARFIRSPAEILPRRLFGRQERYPSALYFSGARKLNALAPGIRSREQIWRAYFATFNERNTESPWEPAWLSATARAGRLITRLDEGMERFRKTKKDDRWWRDASLELAPEERRLLRARLAELAPDTEVPRAVMMVFTSGRPLTEGLDGYTSAHRGCRHKEARGALRAAIAAMKAMGPALSIYDTMRKRITPRMTLPEREREADAAMRRIGAHNLRVAAQEVKRLDVWLDKHPGVRTFSDLRQPFYWLRDWLNSASRARTNRQRVESARAVLNQENLVLRRYRRKSPRFNALDLSLTARGRTEHRAAGRNEVQDEAIPPEARASAGRLNRAITIFADLPQRRR